ncbi:MAG: L-ribulose-5-phosphate 3-epimerase [Verrucomicrobiales bacterium]|jgi:L-ribulose-5-phosphate 3-epimerase
MNSLSRRHFLRTSAAAGAAIAAPSAPLFADHHKGNGPAFKISLAEWSLHKALQGGKMTNLDFPAYAKKAGIEGLEYVNQFFKDKPKDKAYLADLKKRCDDNGVISLLIMCDGLGQLGASDESKRNETVENHKPWLSAAKFLGCHSIRVNAASDGKLSREEQEKLAADGLAKLSAAGKEHGLNVIVENHGGLSSDGAWLSAVMKRVNMDNCGTLPDFGNFRVSGDVTYDRYKGVTELMPFAKAVSAKSHDFDGKGNEIHTDYFKMMDIVLKAGYHGYVGIEYEGGKISEDDGIIATKKLLERVLEKVTAAKAS